MATQYTSLITRAINGFNNVWHALENKTGVLTNAEKSGTSLVDVSLYGQKVNQLVSLVKDGQLFDGSTLHSIEYVDGQKTINTAAQNSVIKGTGKYTLTFNPSAAAYYTTGATLKAEVNATDVAFAPTATGVSDLGDAGYSVSLANALLGTVTIGKGSVVLPEIPVGDITSTIAASVTGLGAASDDIALTKLDTADSTAVDSYYIDLNAAAQTSGKVAVKATANVSEGYVLDGTQTVTGEWTAAGVNATGAARYAVAKGKFGVSTKANTGTADIVAKGTVNPWAASGIEIDAAVTGLELESSVTQAGYIKSGDKATVGSIVVPSAKKFIKVGAIEDQTITLSTDEQIAVSVADGVDILGDGGATINVNLSAVADKTFSEGYVTEAGDVTVTGSKAIKVKKAVVSGSSAISGYNVTGDTAITGGTGYSLTITPTLTTETTFTGAGLVLSKNDVKVSNATQAAQKSYTINIGAGSVALSDIGFTMDGAVTDKDGKTDTISLGDLFIAPNADGSAPSSLGSKTDYFKLKVDSSYVATKGYIEDGNGSKSLTRYVPKAQLEWVKEEDGTEEYIQVKSAGYLPSGVLTQISTVAPDAAVVTLKANASAALSAYVVSAKESGKEYEELTIAKNGVNAGYISDTKGDLAGNKYYIQKGSITGTPSAVVTGTGVSKNAQGGYDVALQAAISNNIVLNPGFITTSNIGTAETQTGTYTLNKAVLAKGTHSTSVVTSSQTVAQGADTSKYVITPSISACTATFTVGTAGYISAADNADLSFSFAEGHGIANGDASKFYILPGTKTGYTFTGASSDLTVSGIDAAGKVSTTSTGSYQVSVAGDINAGVELAEGYYGADEKNVSGKLAVSKTIEIAHGSVSGAVEGSNAISSASEAVEANRVVLYNESEKEAADGETFTKITASAGVTSKTTVTEGYAKQTDVTEGSATLGATSYVKLFKTESATAAGQWKVTVGQTSDVLPETAPTKSESIVLATEHRYSAKDTSVELADNAMGKNVIAEFLRLEARLNGVM